MPVQIPAQLCSFQSTPVINRKHGCKTTKCFIRAAKQTLLAGLKVSIKLFEHAGENPTIGS